MSDWRFYLANSSDLTNICDLTTSARNKSLELGLNTGGTCSFNLPLDHDFAGYVFPIATCIKAYKNKVLKWSGPVWTITEELQSNSFQVNAVGWFEILRKRYLEEKVDWPVSTNRGDIAFDLLDIANAQHDSWIVKGTNYSTATFTSIKTSERFANIGQEIEYLVQLENGFDWVINPETRVMDIYANLGYVQEDVVFGYRYGPSNIKTLSRTIDANEMANRVIAQGEYSNAVSEDTDAQDDYQLFTRVDSLSSVKDTTILAAYCNAEVALNKAPRITFSFQPFPESEDNVPVFLEDYQIGQIVYINAYWEPRIVIEKQPVRVFGTTLQIDENGNEQVGLIRALAT